MTDWKRKAAS